MKGNDQKLDHRRKTWNKQQSVLRKLLLSYDRHPDAIRMFLSQHAQLHAAAMSATQDWSFEDEIFSDLTTELCRAIPTGGEHSIAWLVWHIARIEDVTMSVLVGGGEQVYTREGWMERMQLAVPSTGNLMGIAQVDALSRVVDIGALRAYRTAIGRNTQGIVRALSLEQVKAKVDLSRLQRLLDENAVVPEAQDLIDYWSRRSIAGLLLLPPTRHNFIHLNEALKIKKKLHHNSPNG